MKTFSVFVPGVIVSIAVLAAQQKSVPPPPIQPKPEELAQIREKTERIEADVRELKAKHANPDLVGDVEVYAKAGRFLLEFPDLTITQAAIHHAMTVLDQGIARGRQLSDGAAPWNQGKKQIHAYYSAIDGSVQPYAVTLPEGYDASKSTRLYVWLHGRSNNMTETEFLFAQQNYRPGNPPVADQGQITVDLYGRLNGAGWHWAGEADVFEGMSAVEKRFKIDEKRILLRGFSMGGEGAWHVALQHPDRFAAAEIGAGTVSKRLQTPGIQLEPYQRAVLNIWENMPEWALNSFNLPLAGHDGENDGQLESSLKAKAQLEKEGFSSEGERDFQHTKGMNDLFLVSLNTGHGTSPLVRQRLDAFLKEWGDKGQSSPDHIRFVTYTTRYNRDYWIEVDGLDKHYERADVDAERGSDGAGYDIKTHNVSRLIVRGTEKATAIRIDGQSMKVKPAAEIALQKTGSAWKLERGRPPGLHKTHALQGPIDDAFMDPFLLVRPTGTPWNEAVNEQVLRTLAHFDKRWAKIFRGHPIVKDDKDVTAADIANYHLVLFGDPGSNRLTAKVLGKLPIKWTRQSVSLEGKEFAASENYPAMIYPNPLNPSKYVVLNTGLTAAEQDFVHDYDMPRWGDYAIVKAKEGADVPELVVAGLFNEEWK